jgi:phospholysine phosphohistidine inorganic pyrophosphate phosphatase
MNSLRESRAFLIDLDGVLYNDNQPVPGAAEAIAHLREKGYPFRFATNTTMRCRASLRRKLASFGIEVNEDEIFSASVAAARYLRKQGQPRVLLLLTEDAHRDFAGLEITDQQPDFVVMGDMGDQVNATLLNKAFRLILGGAELIALQKNRYWKTAEGLTLDAGPFVVALEYATGQQARVIGKPSPDFFRLAVDDLGVSPDQVAMVGDDIEVDVDGAQRAGLKGVLVRTGKFRETDLQSMIEPDEVIDSIADLVEYV